MGIGGRDGEEQRRGGEIYSCGSPLPSSAPLHPSPLYPGMLLTTISGLHKLLSRWLSREVCGYLTVAISYWGESE